MSTLKINNLQAVSGGATVPIADVVNGTCRAWVNFNGTGTPAIRASYNVASITDNGVGDFRINFTNALASANYAVTFGGTYQDNNTVQRNYMPTSQAQLTTSVRVLVCDGAAGTAIDPVIVSASIFL